MFLLICWKTSICKKLSACWRQLQTRFLFFSLYKIKSELPSSSKVSLTYKSIVNHYQSFHHPLFTLPMGIGNRLKAFKTNPWPSLNAQVYSLPDKTEGRRKGFLDGTSIDLSSKLSLTYEGNANHYKIAQPRWQFLKQICKLFFQMSFQVYSLFGQTEGERKAFS